MKKRGSLIASFLLTFAAIPVSQATAVSEEAADAQQAAPAVLEISPMAMTYAQIAEATLGFWPLVAGQNIPVGTVTASQNGSVVTVEYEITEPGWCMTQTHAYVGTKAPKWIPGQYPAGDEDLGCTQTAQYSFLLERCVETLYLAAHAVVENWSVPVGGYTTYQVVFQGNGSDAVAYFVATLEEVKYPAYCVDLGRTIFSNRDYQCSIYSSEDVNLPAGVVDKPENLDLINYVNTQYDTATNTYTTGELDELGSPITITAAYKAVQGAIWELIDDAGDCDVNQGSISWTPSVCQDIVDDAYAYGEGFTPGEGDKIKFLVACSDAQSTAIVAQVTGIDVNVDGTYLGEETAWALGGGTQWKQGWGEYQTLELTCP